MILKLIAHGFSFKRWTFLFKGDESQNTDITLIEDIIEESVDLL